MLQHPRDYADTDARVHPLPGESCESSSILERLHGEESKDTIMPVLVGGEAVLTLRCVSTNDVGLVHRRGRFMFARRMSAVRRRTFCTYDTCCSGTTRSVVLNRSFLSPKQDEAVVEPRVQEPTRLSFFDQTGSHEPQQTALFVILPHPQPATTILSPFPFPFFSGQNLVMTLSKK